MCLPQLSNDFICAPTTVKTTEELLRQSPIHYNFISETIQSPGPSKAAPGAYASQVAAPIRVHHLSHLPDEPARSGPAKTFSIYLHASQRHYAHRTEVRRNPIHGRWPSTAKEEQDTVYWALREVVPDNIAREGLCDWHTGGQFSDDAQAMRISADHAELWHQYERQHKHERPSRQTLMPEELVTWKSVVERAVNIPGSQQPEQAPNPDLMTKSEAFKSFEEQRKQQRLKR